MPSACREVRGTYLHTYLSTNLAGIGGTCTDYLRCVILHIFSVAVVALDDGVLPPKVTHLASLQHVRCTPRMVAYLPRYLSRTGER